MFRCGEAWVAARHIHLFSSFIHFRWQGELIFWTDLLLWNIDHWEKRDSKSPFLLLAARHWALSLAKSTRLRACARFIARHPRAGPKPELALGHP